MVLVVWEHGEEKLRGSELLPWLPGSSGSGNRLLVCILPDSDICESWKLHLAMQAVWGSRGLQRHPPETLAGHR